MKILINNKEYTFLKGYQKENKYREAFNQLAKNIFSLSFEEWYQAGFWNDKYIPYTLFDEDKAVANLSVNIMDFNTFGEKKRYIQIGTVMTDEAYRNKNLSRFLMEQALDEWNGNCDFIYLFANNTVLEIYPKFGFHVVKEYTYYKSIEGYNNKPSFEKIDMDKQENKDLLYRYAKKSNPCSNFSMQENADLVLFYCSSFLKDNVYYIPSLNVICIAIFDNHLLHLWDVFGLSEVDLEKVISALKSPEIKEVLLGFSPKNNNTYLFKEIRGDDTLFIQQSKTNLFQHNKLMFPLLSHA